MAWLWGWTRATFRRANWHWVTLNLAALVTLVYVVTRGTTGWNGTEETFDRMLESGKWGIRFLLVSLSMTPLHTYLRWSGAIKLRKPAGLWAFIFGATHFLLYAHETWEPIPAYWTNGTPWYWLTWPLPLYVALGLLALAILTALALTSNRWSMRRLGKRWKPLHRLVYGAGLAITLHALLAASMSKKMMVRDPQVVPELRLYLGIVTLLLVIRIPQVRGLLLSVMTMGRPRLRTVVPVAPIVLPSRTLPLRHWPPLDTPKAASKLAAMPDGIELDAGPEGENQPNMATVAEARAREPTY